MQSLEERVRRIEDREAIRDLWYEYFFTLDSFDWSGLAGVFTPDATLEIAGLDGVRSGSDSRYHGTDEIISFYRSFMTDVCAPEKGHYFTGHHGTNMKIELNGDRATTLACFFDVAGTDTIISGTYQHVFERRDDVWKLHFIRVAIRYTAQIQVTDPAGLSLPEVLAMDVPG